MSELDPISAGEATKWSRKDFIHPSVDQARDDFVDTMSYSIASSYPKNKWRYWFVENIYLNYSEDISWWRRFWVKFFFGGKWERLSE